MEAAAFPNIGLIGLLLAPGILASFLGGGLPAIFLYTALTVTSPLPPATLPTLPPPSILR